MTQSIHKIVQDASRRQLNESPGAYIKQVTGVSGGGQRKGSLKDEVYTNFSVHLCLARLMESPLSGNLLADFIRGNPEEGFPSDIVVGIHMRRRIGVLADNLPEVRETREWLRNETRRVAPITLDVMWDRFLSRH